MGNKYGFVAEHRPRDSGTVFKKFLMWNVDGVGKRLSSMRGASYWYCGDIFYNIWDPAARVMHAPGGQPFVFTKRGLYFFGRGGQEIVLPEYIIEVDYLGVAGPYEALCTEKEFLRSVLTQCAGRAGHFVETIAHTSPKSANEYFRMKADHEKRDLTYPYHQWMYDGWAKQISDAAASYDKVKEAFKLSAPHVDFLRMQHDFWTIVQRKAGIHDSPVNVKKRERTQARQEAMLALNV